MRKRSIMLAIATVLSSIYAVYLICYFIGGTASANGVEAVSGAIATALVLPHMFMFVLGAIFGWIGYLFRKSWAALVAAIFYSIGAVLFLVYAMFGIPLLILGFIGYAKQKKINKNKIEEKE